MKNKIDTLFFVLESNEEKYEFKINEILEQINKQKNNFIKIFEYEPEFINIEQKIVDYLFRNQLKVITIKNIGYPKIIYNMKIKLRDNNFGLFSNEIICLEGGNNEK